MPLLYVMLSIAAAGFLLYLINKYVPMADSIKLLLNAVVVVSLAIFLINLLAPGLLYIPVGGRR